MRSKTQLKNYQTKAIDFSMQHAQAALWLDMGLGKTAVSLTSIVERQDLMQVYGTLVIAPLRVIQTVWRQEAAQWEHTRHLRFSLIHGDIDTRHRAMRMPADVYLVNYEGLEWLVQQLIHVYLSRGKYLPFNQVIFDEVSKLNNSDTKRHTALRQILAFLPYRIGLTGTPGASGYLGLFGQYLAIDSGARLGTVKSHYIGRYFRNEGWGMGSRYEIEVGAEQRIHETIEDITLQMSASDYLELPSLVINDIWVDLPPKAREQYERLEREMFMEFDSGAEMEVFNAAALTTKCLQAANGAIYVETGGPWDLLHDAKLEALDDIREEAAGKPILVTYSFQHDAERIQKKWKDAEKLSSKLSDKVYNNLIAKWDEGKVPMLIGHPKSMGHGLNLQKGSDTLVWFGCPWSLEQYQQTIDRLAGGLRRSRPVVVHRIFVRGTTDEAVRLSLMQKTETQEGLKSALNEYRRQKTGLVAA